MLALVSHETSWLLGPAFLLLLPLKMNIQTRFLAKCINLWNTLDINKEAGECHGTWNIFESKTEYVDFPYQIWYKPWWSLKIMKFRGSLHQCDCSPLVYSESIVSSVTAMIVCKTPTLTKVTQRKSLKSAYKHHRIYSMCSICILKEYFLFLLLDITCYVLL